ncbi:hypothetical protein JQ597_25360 [Bradyrhizobium sp. AUGA SZCCT0177]|uniref:sigma factor-like helix-turn-helix DNA-binding protein n=1 Tax=Bradyrhizobium sp. AUGA SZCCT0177 TaxID=2807665 RepID=UPI001BA9354D|nr:sigma factor-like helix-turn-helix DNA-binding protein [Bradyrhizobium sp. AUGA SZCCT0177]MBR1285383.1 hypothetical protein [Bradyrhizobium sp. AUGA SZCCT0177]
MSEIRKGMDQTLEWLVQNNDASVRLSNCVIADREIATTTIREFLADAEHMRRRLHRTPNLGTKSANELFGLVEHFSANPHCYDLEPIQVVETPAQQAFRQLLLLVSQVSFPDAVLEHDISVRLRNILEKFKSAQRVKGNWEAGVIALNNVLADWPVVRTRFLQKQNSGRKTVAELEMLVVKITNDKFFSLCTGLGFAPEVALKELSDKSLNPSVVKVLNAANNFVSRPSSETATAPPNHVASSSGSPAASREDTIPRQSNRSDGGPITTILGVTQNGSPALLAFLREFLDHRQFDVLSRRYGILVSTTETLEEISVGYGLTRERVRQIEKAALGKCKLRSARKIFEAYLKREEPTIVSTVVGPSRCILSEDALAQESALDPLHCLAIDVCDGSLENWLKEHLTPIKRNRDVIGWAVRNQSDEDALRTKLLAAIPATSSLRRRIIAALAISNWPFNVNKLAQHLPGIPIQQLESVLREEFGASLKEGVITAISELPAATRLLIVLRAAGGPVSLKDVRAKHLQIFGQDIQEHAAGAVIPRLKEALIVERGTYCLYTQLSFDKPVIDRIKSVVYETIKKTAQFLSAKVLYRAVRKRLPPEESPGLSEYMILSFCHDDSRFSVRRGLMIGLATADFERKFISLDDTIHKIMKENAPLRVAEIKQHMANAREVLDTSVLFVLKNSPDFVLKSSGLYDLITHAIGDSAKVSHLSNAIEIALIDKDTSAQVLMAHLRAVGIKYELATIISYLAKMPNVASRQGVFQLETPSPDVYEYNRRFRALYATDKNIGRIQKQLENDLLGHPMSGLVHLDYRLVMEPSAWDHAESMNQAQSAVLHGLLREFEFS